MHTLRVWSDLRASDNVRAGEAEEREMRTGKHVARDVYCVGCDTIVGWKYVSCPYMCRTKGAD
jgi:hypothetical protein